MSLLSIQAANVLKTSKDVLKITTDDFNTKVELAAANDSRWVPTSGPSTRKKGNKWCIYLRRRNNTKLLKGKQSEAQDTTPRLLQRWNYLSAGWELSVSL